MKGCFRKGRHAVHKIQFKLLNKYIKENHDGEIKLSDPEFWVLISQHLNKEEYSVKEPDGWKMFWYHMKMRKVAQSFGEVSPSFEVKIRGPNINEEQISLLVDLMERNVVLANIRRPKEGQAEPFYEFWDIVTSLLNARGPLVADSECWRKFWSDLKRFTRRKELTPLMQKIIRIADGYSRVRTDKQIELMVNLMEKNPPPMVFSLKYYQDMAEILNKDGPCIKSGLEWRSTWKNYKSTVLKKIKNLVPLSELEQRVLQMNATSIKKVSRDQNKYLAKCVEDGNISMVDTEFWDKISVILNELGPAIKNPEEWKKTYITYKKTRNTEIRRKNNIPTDCGYNANNRRVNDKQRTILENYAKNVNDEEGWEQISEKLNREGPPTKATADWKKYWVFLNREKPKRCRKKTPQLKANSELEIKKTTPTKKKVTPSKSEKKSTTKRLKKEKSSENSYQVRSETVEPTELINTPEIHPYIPCSWLNLENLP